MGTGLVYAGVVGEVGVAVFEVVAFAVYYFVAARVLEGVHPTHFGELMFLFLGCLS